MTARSGQVTVTTAGTAVRGTTQKAHLVAFKAAPANTGIIYIGDDDAGDVASTNGFPLEPGEAIVMELNNVNDIWVDSSVNGEKVCWLRLD